MNENGGNIAYDLSGYGNHGVLTNMAVPPNPSSGWVPGSGGSAIATDITTTDYINLGNAPSLDIFGEITMAARVMAHTTPTGGQFRNIISAGWTGQVGYYMDLRQVPNPEIAVGLYFGGGHVGVSMNWGLIPILQGEYYDIVGVWDGIWRLYVDGVERGTAGGVGAQGLNGSTGVYLGGQAGSANWWDGQFDYFFLYNRGLSPEEVWDMHVNPYALQEWPEEQQWQVSNGVAVPGTWPRFF